MYSFLSNKLNNTIASKNNTIASINNVYKIFNNDAIKNYENINKNKNIDIKQHIVKNVVNEKDECVIPFHTFDRIVIQEVKPLMSFIKTLQEFFKIFNKDIVIENIDENYMFNTDICYILLAVHKIRNIPVHINYYIYNLEQISYYPYFPLLTEKLGSENFDKKMNYMINRYKCASGILDFSKDNISLYPKEINQKIFYFPPPCIYSNRNYKKNYKYDILFFGARSKRRTSILSKIRTRCDNIKFYIVNNIYDDNLVDLINQSKVVLNLHYDDNASLETIRIHECIMNNTHVISEEPKNKNISLDNLYKNIVTFFPHIKNDLSNISSAISVIKYVISNIEKYSQKELYKSKKKFIDYYNNYFINTFLYDNIYFNIRNSNKSYYDENIEKYNHRNICIKDSIILNSIDFKCDEKTLDLEAVLIEFRPLLHLEFLIENALFRLPNWKHSVVCGNNNVTMINRIVEKLNKKHKCIIKIIFLDDIHNITPSQYSTLLMSKNFWHKFVANKVLLYQEDTIIFHSKYDDFLIYDYIGAPWPVSQDDNYLGVGNGGFSLRSKSKMIEVIDKVSPNKLILGESTIRYMKSTGNTIIPEDVYFSKSLIDFNIGNVSDRHTANAFSQETIKHHNPFGGHNYWLSELGGVCKPGYFYNYYIKDRYYLNVNHRFGWKHLIQYCIGETIIQMEKKATSKLLIDCCENYFLWGKEKNKIVQEDWYGILHYTNELPEIYDFCNLDKVLQNKNFKQSLQNCKGLIVLSKYMRNYLKSIFAYEIPIYFIPHPMAEVNKKFNLDKFKENQNLNIIQIGLQYRKILDIYKLKTTYPKIWLPGSNDTKKITSILKLEEEYNKYTVNMKSVSIMVVNDKVYDSKILNNIVLIPLWNASANNSILECMRMNIPAFISNIAPVKEYLGKDYPMYYDDIKEVERIIHNKEYLYQLYERTHRYLVKLDKSIIDYKYFTSELLSVINVNK